MKSVGLIQITSPTGVSWSITNINVSLIFPNNVQLLKGSLTCICITQDTILYKALERLRNAKLSQRREILNALSFGTRQAYYGETNAAVGTKHPHK